MRVAERRDTALADIDAGEAGRRRDREAVVADLPADLLAEYDRRRARGGTGAALAAGAPLRGVPAGAGPDGARARCGRHRPDEVVYCEECGTVLVPHAASRAS